MPACLGGKPQEAQWLSWGLESIVLYFLGGQRHQHQSHQEPNIHLGRSVTGKKFCPDVSQARGSGGQNSGGQCLGMKEGFIQLLTNAGLGEDSTGREMQDFLILKNKGNKICLGLEKKVISI